MRNWSRKLDVPHALAPNDCARYFNPALVADDPFIADTAVLAAVTLPILSRPEYPFIEKTVALGAYGAVVDSFWLGNFAVRPRQNPVRRGQFQTYAFKISYLCFHSMRCSNSKFKNQNGSKFKM